MQDENSEKLLGIIKAAALDVSSCPPERREARLIELHSEWIRMARTAGANAPLALNFADQTLAFTKQLLGMID